MDPHPSSDKLEEGDLWDIWYMGLSPPASEVRN